MLRRNRDRRQPGHAAYRDDSRPAIDYDHNHNYNYNYSSKYTYNYNYT